MDDHKRHIWRGYTCRYCGPAPKRQAVRMARHRLRAEDRRTLGPAVEQGRIDDMIDADYRAIEAAGGCLLRRLIV